MSRAVKVYIKGKYAGVLEEKDRNHYSFRYDDAYYNDPDTPCFVDDAQKPTGIFFCFSFLSFPFNGNK